MYFELLFISLHFHRYDCFSTLEIQSSIWNEFIDLNQTKSKQFKSMKNIFLREKRNIKSYGRCHGL